jgi:hypothetical protein
VQLAHLVVVRVVAHRAPRPHEVDGESKRDAITPAVIRTWPDGASA